MGSFKVRLWCTFTTIGLLGVASLLLSDFPLDSLPPEVKASVPPESIKFLMLVNPTLLLIVSTTLGTVLYNKTFLFAPVFENWLGKPEAKSFQYVEIVKRGVVGGLLAGTGISVIGTFFAPYLPPSLTTQNVPLHVITKLLYGGITEELLVRFGGMGVLVWFLSKIAKKHTSSLYWTAIVLASLLFALGHLPLVFLLVKAPSFAVYAYFILGNGIGGLIFGYAYYKSGLETAFIAHACAHLTMIALDLVISSL